MSDDERALQACIAASPDDDLPRLVYADWLEEHDEGIRAEFIRLQCEIAKLETGPRAIIDQNIPLWKRQQELLNRDWVELLGEDWNEFFANRNHHTELRRGFIEKIEFRANEFVALAHLIPQMCMVARHIEVERFVDSHEAMFALPRETLDMITAISFGDYEAAQGWSDEYYATIGARFTTVAPWSRLRKLDLIHYGMGDEIIALMFNPNTYPALRDLDLRANDLTSAGVIALINSGVPQRLTRLILSSNSIDDQAAYELADRVASNTSMKELGVRNTQMTSAGQSALLARFGGRIDLY